jgi:hypothetical protein
LTLYLRGLKQQVEDKSFDNDLRMVHLSAVYLRRDAPEQAFGLAGYVAVVVFSIVRIFFF